jgi:hypothetical protein
LLQQKKCTSFFWSVISKPLQFAKLVSLVYLVNFGGWSGKTERIGC